jgi:hypothetical protein
MSGLVLRGIHVALADQIRAGIDRQTNVYEFPNGSYNPPSVTVHSDPSGYISYWGTFGPNGDADILLRLKIEVDAGDLASVCIKIADYLSVGTDNGSSIVDAVMADRTLGGVVGDCVILTAEWDTENEPFVAYLPVQIILRKVNAEVA